MSSFNQNADNHLVAELGEGRILAKLDGQEIILGGPSKAELKTDFVLEMNLEKFFKVYPIERIGLQTHTFDPSVTEPKEAGIRFNSFRTNFFCNFYDAYIKVTEPHKDGRPHFHILVALKFDIRTGFDWLSYQQAQQEYAKNGRSKEFYRLTRAYSQSATPELREYWKLLRNACATHRMGRSEILPIRKNTEATGYYIREYLTKGNIHRTGPWKGARLVSYSAGFERVANCQFSWVDQGAKWRNYVGQVCTLLSIKDLEELHHQFGNKWAHQIYRCLILEMEPAEAANVLFQFNRVGTE